MPDEKTNSNHELIENYDDVTWLYNWWPMVKSNFKNLLDWVTAHINGTGDRHSAADIDYNSGTVEDGLTTLSNAIETGLSELADADAENCKYTIHQSYDVDISKIGSGNNVLYITIDGVNNYSQMSGKAVAINTGIYQCTFSSPSPVYVNVNGLGNKALRRPLPYDYADYDTKQYYTDKYCYGEIGRHQTLIVYYDGSNFILTNVAVPTKATKAIELESTDDSSYTTPKAVGVIAGKVKDDIGDLSELNTTDKTDIVNAINSITFGESVDAKKEVDIDDNFQPVNYNAYTNSGRYRFNHYSENTEGEAVDFEGTEILIVQNYVMKTDGYLYYVIQCSFYNGSIKFRYGFDDYEGVKWNDWITVAPNDVGDLSTLTTTDKSSAVGAINEVNNKKILAGDGQSDTLYKNCLGISVRDHGTVSSLNHDSLVTIGQHIIDFEVPACAGAPSNLSAGSYSGVIETVSQYKDASGDDADVYFNQCKQTLTLIKGLTSSTNGTWERYYYQTNDEDMTYTDWVSLEDELKSVSSNVQRPVTVFVAASDASAKSKSGADYICTGTNDEETIQAAINSIVSTGGVIQLSEGTFYFSNNRTSGAVSGIALDSGIALKGAGSSTVINTYNTSGFSDDPAIGVTGSDNVTISDMLIMSGDYKFSYSIDINGSSNVKVNNIIFTLQGSDSGIFRIYNSSDVNVINSRFEVTESQTNILVGNNSKNILIKNNVFNVYDWEAIYVYGGVSNVIIDGNFFNETYSNVGNSAINVHNELSNIMITNNVIDFPLEPVKVNSTASGKVFVYNNMVKTPPTASAVVRINMDGSSNNWNQTF